VYGEFIHINSSRGGLGKLANIDKMPVYGRSSSHGRADKVCSPARTLATFEITIAGGGASLAWFQSVCIHGKAHGAPWFTPLKTRGLKDFVQSFSFSLLFDEPGAWYHQSQLHIFSNFLAQFAYYRRSLTHVFDAAVGARTDKHFIDKQVV
jgi:hypothetical protein